jgi:hypothetical protein
MAQPPTQLTIRDERDDRSSSFAQVKIGDDGAFVFEGVDAGPDVEKFFGDSDFEYWLRVKPEDKDAMLLHLVKEHFGSVHAFKEWLAQHQITAEFTSY